MPRLLELRSKVAPTVIRIPGVPRLLGLRGRRRRSWTIQHYAKRRPAVTGRVVPDKARSEEDVAIAARLLDAYRAATRDAVASSGDRADLWTEISRTQGSFLAVLDRGDSNELADYLVNVSRHDASTGISQGDAEFARITRDRSYQAFLASMTQDKLVSLAEAVGAVAVENPEGGSFGESILLPPGLLVERVSERLGIDIAPPDVDGGLFKVDTGSGLFGERDANAIYTAHLLARTLKEQASPSVLEIGGGTGRVAYWSNRFGLKSYSIVDLPRINVVQGYYLLKALSLDRVRLYGEESRSSEEVHIVPDHALPPTDGRRFDLVLNQDSLPEMNADTARDYLLWIRDSADRFLSINHESKPPYGRDKRIEVSVPEVIAGIDGFELQLRFPYWMRRGYVVELYRVGP
jgi:hypothetical protein